MGSYGLQGLARNCPRHKFYAWYTDFGSEDPSIINRYKQPTSDKMLTRRLISREGNRLQVETAYDFMGRKIKGEIEITLTPDNYTYTAVIVVANMFEDCRSYQFTETPEGTKITMQGVYHARSLMMKMVDTLGLFKRRYVKESQRTTDALCRAAEVELANSY